MLASFSSHGKLKSLGDPQKVFIGQLLKDFLQMLG